MSLATILARLPAPLRAQVEQTPSLRWMLAVVALLVAMLVLQSLSERKSNLLEAVANEHARLAHMRVVGEERAWIKRAQDASDIHAALLAEIPTMQTAGLAQASLQSWLRTTASSLPTLRGLSIDTPQVATVDAAQGIVRIRARVNGSGPPRQVLQLIQRIESSANLMTVETAQIRNDQNKSFALTLASYYRIVQVEGD